MSTPSFAHVQWRKSTYSLGQNDQCVEVAAVQGVVGVRDSKDPSGPKVILRSSAFRRLVADVRDGVHDL
ncbi:DUF397 domain-containing protein [Actinomadura algeriensis]|uniref:DUF397 domain-containing protein n=1 Tax=Actinomadura algeriensis TaxID=1679523 RepID=A0ABR9JPG5_9ACTN|nr:DUF397 domain-containing protein [Actinomadura algeriensis]MBE1532460.1 hypothetical protein [Actinomadura algeriensis]